MNPELRMNRKEIEEGRMDAHVVYSHPLSFSLSLAYSHRDVHTHTHALQAPSITLLASFPSDAASHVSLLRSIKRRRDPTRCTLAA